MDVSRRERRANGIVHTKLNGISAAEVACAIEGKIDIIIEEIEQLTLNDRVTWNRGVAYTLFAVSTVGRRGSEGK